MTTDPLRPGRPGTCAYARIDEAKVHATGQGSAWLTEETQWFHLAGMLTVTRTSLVGGIVYLHCSNKEHAQNLLDIAIRHGVPKICTKVVDRLSELPPA